MLIALLPGIKPFLLIAFRIVSYRETFPDLVSSYIYAMMIMAVPFLSKMIFGAYPLEALRARISSRNLESLNMTPSVVIKRSADIGETTSAASVEGVTVSEQASRLEQVSFQPSRSKDPRDLLYRYAEESADLARRVYTRAGVYLMVGVLIALGGLGFFYVRSINLPTDTVLVDRLLSLLPGFGVLFFMGIITLT